MNLTPPLLDPRNDVVFKLLFTRTPQLLHAMLEAVLATSITGATVLNPELPGDLSGDKSIVLDIRVELANGARVDVEMQVRVTPELPGRLVYYAARDYAQQLSRGEHFDELTPTILVVWLEQPLFLTPRLFHRVFGLREQRSGELFSEQLAIHVLQLRDWAFGPDEPSPFDASLQRWARFLAAESVEHIASLVKEDPIMAEAAHSLERLSRDPEAARLAREREDSAKFYELGLAMSRREGRQEGLVEGRQEGLVEGERLGLRQSIVQLCAAFGLTLTREQERRLTGSAEELRELLNHVARHRTWPDS